MENRASYLTILGLVVSMSTGSLNLSANVGGNHISHMPQDGDRLRPLISLNGDSITHIDKSNRLVSLSESDFTDEGKARVYVDADTISYVQFATRHVFTINDGSLLYRGYENRASDFRPGRPIHVGSIASVSPYSAISDSWTARVSLHGLELLKMANGISSTHTQHGWAIANETDTIRGLTYVVWEMDMAYFDTDSIDSLLPDSINSIAVSDMELHIGELARERMLTRREIWFSPDARYPVLIKSSALRLTVIPDSPSDTIPMSIFASFYPPDLQLEDLGEEAANPHRTMRDKVKPSRNPLKKDAGSPNEDRVQVSEATIGDDRISVSVSSDIGSEELSLTLFSPSGMRLSETIKVTVGAIQQTIELPLPQESGSVVILFMESDSGSTSRKIIL